MNRPRNIALAIVLASFAPALVLAQPGPHAPKVAPTALRSIPAETTAAAYVDKNWKVPRTSWGHPSLEGVWSTDDLRGVPMNRPEKIGNRETLTQQEFLERARGDETTRDFDVKVGTFLQHESGIRSFGYSSLVVDPPNGTMPKLTAHGEALAATRVRGTFGPGPFDKIDDFSLYDRCITRGVLGSLLPVIYGNGLRIAQNPESVAISYEMIHDTRIIPLDARAPIDPSVRQIMGVARGHFEGDTLVVVTTNFTDRTSVGVNGNGTPNSDQMKLTERFKRVDPEMIEYRATVDDPGAYAAPWTIRLMITSRPGYEMYEYNCHEGNFAVRGALAGEREYERQVAEAKRKGLPIPARAVEHEQIRNGGAPEGTKPFNINAGE